MKYIIDTEANSIVGPIKDFAKPQDVKAKDLMQFHELYANSAKFETGLMAIDGSGLLSYRRGGGYEQIVFQHKPEIHNVKWGNYERDPNAKIYQLAQPYKILISDYKDGVFLGTRHFFSPEPIVHWDQPLYATGFSNTNNIGYSGNSIGWTCLYHYSPVVSVNDLAGKIDYAIIRENGVGEPYNYGNMSSTDGPTFYKTYMPKKTHFHSAEEWHKKTKKEGLKWVFDPDNFIVYKILPENIMNPDWHAQSTTFDDKAIPYTLRHATHGSYVAYYPSKSGGDTEYIRPFNREQFISTDAMDAIIRTTMLTTSKDHKFQGLGKGVESLPAFSAASKKELEKFKYRSCPCCDNKFPTETQFVDVIVAWNEATIEDTMTSIVKTPWCDSCAQDYAVEIPIFGNLLLVNTDLLYWVDGPGIWVLPWEVNYCSNCALTSLKSEHQDINVYSKDHPDFCYACYPGEVELCSISNKYYPLEELITTSVLTWTGASLEPQSCYVAQEYKDRICMCGIKNNTVPWIKDVPAEYIDGVGVCSSCVIKPLIQKNVPVSVTVTDKES